YTAMSEGLFSLTGKTALVTGGSAGLGYHFARVLAEAGANVALAARGKERLDLAVSKLQSSGFKAEGFVCDVSKADEVATLIDDVRAVSGPIDILINDAGTCVFKKTLDFQPQDWDAVLGTNLKGVW